MNSFPKTIDTWLSREGCHLVTDLTNSTSAASRREMTTKYCDGWMVTRLQLMTEIWDGLKDG